MVQRQPRVVTAWLCAMAIAACRGEGRSDGELGGLVTAEPPPKPIDVELAAKDARHQAERAFAALSRVPASVVTPDIDRLLARREEALATLDALFFTPKDAVKTRIHGDFHLGQVLVSDSDLYIVDFEGEPSRSAEDRRGKFSPLRDVAGMLRSFAYAAETACMEVSGRLSHVAPRVRMAADEFRILVSEAFLAGYERAARGTPIWADERETRRNLLQLHLLAKAFYEIAYEADNRPDWIGTPVHGVLEALEQENM